VKDKFSLITLPFQAFTEGLLNSAGENIGGFLNNFLKMLVTIYNKTVDIDPKDRMIIPLLVLVTVFGGMGTMWVLGSMSELLPEGVIRNVFSWLGSGMKAPLSSVTYILSSFVNRIMNTSIYIARTSLFSISFVTIIAELAVFLKQPQFLKTIQVGFNLIESSTIQTLQYMNAPTYSPICSNPFNLKTNDTVCFFGENSHEYGNHIMYFITTIGVIMFVYQGSSLLYAKMITASSPPANTNAPQPANTNAPQPAITNAPPAITTAPPAITTAPQQDITSTPNKEVSFSFPNGMNIKLTNTDDKLTMEMFKVFLTSSTPIESASSLQNSSDSGIQSSADSLIQSNAEESKQQVVVPSTSAGISTSSSPPRGPPQHEYPNVDDADLFDGGKHKTKNASNKNKKKNKTKKPRKTINKNKKSKFNSSQKKNKNKKPKTKKHRKTIRNK
jgi:hypothetical protein